MKKFLSVLLVLFIFSNSLVPTRALEGQESADYTIEPVTKTNQLNKNAGYFHLQVDEKAEDTLEILVHNNSKEKAEYEIEFNIARTNRNGLIVYQLEQSWGPNDSLEYNIEDFISIRDSKLSIEAGQTKSFIADLKLNNIKFSNILLGAFTVNKISQNVEEEGIYQEYLYELGLVLTQKKDATLPNSKLLDLGKVKMNLEDGHKVLDFQILNNEANISRNLNLHTKLFNKDKEKLVFDEKVENMSIAPNGILSQTLDWDRREVQAGSYQLKIQADDEKETWTWVYDFDIDAKEAENMNENATRVVKYPSWTLTIFIILAILTILNTIFLVRRSNKESKKNKG